MTILRWNLTVNEFIFVLELLFIFMKNYYGQHLAYMCMYLSVLSFNAGALRWRHGRSPNVGESEGITLVKVP